MRLSKEQTFLLIVEVKKREIIWDYLHEFYRDKQRKHSAWLELCQDLFEDFHSKSDVQKNALVRHAIARWRGVRDAYVRMRKKQKESNAKGIKGSGKYVFGDQLLFLEKSLTPRSNSRASSSEGQSSQFSDFEDTEYVHQKENTTRSFVIQSPKREPASPVEIEHSHFVEHHQAKLPNFVVETEMKTEDFIENPHSTKNDSNDEDMAFFMSLMPTLKKLNAFEKFDFRIHTMKYLQSQMRRHDNDSQIASSSSDFQFAELPERDGVSSDKMILPDIY